MNCPITGKPCSNFKAYHVTNISEKELKVFEVCEDCLSQANANLTKESNDLIKKEMQISCDFCNLTLEELLKVSRIGCERCYEVFEKPLTIAFEKMQRAPDLNNKELKHVGRVPSQWKKKQARKINPNNFLLEIKQELDALIKEENYEKCKDLKNKIFFFESLLRKEKEYKNDQEQQDLIKDQIFEFIYLYGEQKEKEKE